MPCIPSARDITILYPVGTATIVTIDIDTDLSFVTKRDTDEQGYLAVRTKQLVSTSMIPRGVAYSRANEHESLTCEL